MITGTVPSQCQTASDSVPGLADLIHDCGSAATDSDTVTDSIKQPPAEAQSDWYCLPCGPAGGLELHLLTGAVK